MPPARVLGGFGDNPRRFGGAPARKNYSGQSPITRASGKKTVVLAPLRKEQQTRRRAALPSQVVDEASPGARAYCDAMRARNMGHHAALRQLANRLVGIQHGCLKTMTEYDENTTWQHHKPAVDPIAA